MIEGVVAFVISVVAALIYRDFRLQGEPSTVKRIVAFGVGFPWSLIVMAVVDFRPDRLTAGEEEAADLLEEIRRETKALETNPEGEGGGRDAGEPAPKSRNEGRSPPPPSQT